MSMRIYVGNLAFQTTSQELEELFSQAGAVESASIVTDRDSGLSRGFAFVKMSLRGDGEAAITRFNGIEIKGRSLTVNEAKPRENRQSFGGGGRNGSEGSHGGRRSYGSGRSRY